MKNTRFWAVVLLLVFSVGLLAGCSPAELGYWKLKREMADLKLYEVSGEIDFDLKQVPPEVLTGEEGQRLKLLLEFLAGLKFSYEGKVDLNQQVMEYTFYLLDRNTGAQRELTAFIMDKDQLYLKIGELVSYLKLLGDQDLNQILASLGEAQYLSINLSSLVPAVDNPLAPNLLEQSQKETELLLQFFQGLITEVYHDFETGLVTKSGNKYTLSLTAEDGVNLIKPLLIYSMEHGEKLGKFLQAFVNNLSAEELQLLGLEPDMLEELDAIDETLNELKNNREEYLAQLTELETELKGILLPILAGSKLISSVQKQDDTYQVELDVTLKITEPQKSEVVLELDVAEQSRVKAAAPFKLNTPSSGIISWEEFLAKLEGQTSIILTIQTANGSYTLNKGRDVFSGTMDVKVEKGSTYLPLRQVVEAFGETVTWDPKENQAFVLREGKEIAITGQVVKGRTIIKIRDFEKLGYKVHWDGATNTVTIIKSN